MQRWAVLHAFPWSKDLWHPTFQKSYPRIGSPRWSSNLHGTVSPSAKTSKRHQGGENAIQNCTLLTRCPHKRAFSGLETTFQLRSCLKMAAIRNTKVARRLLWVAFKGALSDLLRTDIKLKRLIFGVAQQKTCLPKSKKMKGHWTISVLEI